MLLFWGKEEKRVENKGNHQEEKPPYKNLHENRLFML